jgi:hypothetical protein
VRPSYAPTKSEKQRAAAQAASKTVIDSTQTEARPAPLVKYDAACQAIAELKSVDAVKDFRDKAMAMQVYARQAENRQLEADAAEIRMRATRRLGELIEEQKATVGLNEGGRPVKTGLGNNPVSEKPTLASQSIDKNLAHEARTLGAMPEPEFNKAVENKRESLSKRKPKDRKPAAKKATKTKDVALSDFNARFLELLRLIGTHQPTRFAGTAVKADDLATVGKFLTDLAGLKQREAAG